MKSRILIPAVLSAALLVAATAWSDGLVYQLPDDGAWALFDLKVTAGSENPREMNGTLKLSSVGSSVEEDEQCRWIEMNMTMHFGDERRSIVAKMLVPEEHLQRGRSPYDHMVRGWIRIRAESEVDRLTDGNKGPLPGFLSGPLRDSKQLEPATRETPLGQLKCERVSGFVEFKDNRNDNRIDFENSLHEKAPFGVVASTMDVAVKRDEKVVESVKMELTLSKTGSDAKSELPEHK